MSGDDELVLVLCTVPDEATAEKLWQRARRSAASGLRQRNSRADVVLSLAGQSRDRLRDSTADQDARGPVRRDRRVDPGESSVRRAGDHCGGRGARERELPRVGRRADSVDGDAGADTGTDTNTGTCTGTNTGTRTCVAARARRAKPGATRRQGNAKRMPRQGGLRVGAGGRCNQTKPRTPPNTPPPTHPRQREPEGRSPAQRAAKATRSVCRGREDYGWGWAGGVTKTGTDTGTGAFRLGDRFVLGLGLGSHAG